MSAAKGLAVPTGVRAACGALGVARATPVLNCRNHELYKPSGYKCALKEGLADYGGSVAHPTRIRWENNVTDPPPGRGAGEIEGNVAALFHDLFDSNNEGDDEVTYRGRYILRVFKTCNPSHGSRDDVADIRDTWIQNVG